MAIARWDPSRDTLSLREAMNRVFEDSVVRPMSDLGRSGGPPMDVYMEGDNYVIEMALPGLPPDSVNVTVLGNQVTVSGEYSSPPEGRQYLLQEQPRGRFQRTIVLPTEVDPNQAHAHHENGMVWLTLPKAENAKPHRIRIGNGSVERPQGQAATTSAA